MGADRALIAEKIFYTGSVKWLNGVFDRHDFAAMIRASAQIPGGVDGETGLVIVSRSGVAPNVDADLVWTPDDVLVAWG